MEFKSIREILNFAISKEQASIQFYKDMASRMHNPITQSIFEVLAGQEQKHVEALELELMKFGVSVAPSGELKTPFIWEERLELDDSAQDMDYRDALRLAIQKERAAFQLYTQLLGLFQDSAFRGVLMELAEEEMRHVLQFEHEYNAFMKQKG